MDQWKPGTPLIPKDDLVEIFHGWDRTKDKSKLRSFHRAKEWISTLLKCPSTELPKGHNMRQIDYRNALEHMLEPLRSGASLETYIKSILKEPKKDLPQIPDSGLQVQNGADDNSQQTLISTQSTQENETSVDNGNGVDKKDADAGSVSKLDPKTEGSKRPPVCRLSWKAKECVDKDCPRIHPPLCRDPRCWDFDQDLPLWKSSGCVNFHGRQKSQLKRKKPIKSATSVKPSGKKPNLSQMQPKPQAKWNQQGRQKSQLSRQKPTSSAASLRPPMAKKSKGNLPKVPSQKPNSFQSSKPIRPQPKPQAEWNWHPAGNDQATWPPLSRSGNMEWGNGQMPYNMAAQGLRLKRPTQLELLQNQVQNLTQLMHQVLQA